jgi:2-methylisocitrate lyase-like PEP mutase family enzyme
MTSKAELFARMHQTGNPLLLPNAWDAASAVTIVAAGATAVATTSAGVAWSLGVPDGADLGPDRAAAAVARIVAAVGVPVSADIEAGYGLEPDSVAATTTAVVQAGAVGINVEDRVGADLLKPAQQAERLTAAREAADRLGVPIWINARTDAYLAGDDAERRLESVLDRAAAYARAGADSLFVPGLIDLADLAVLAKGPLPIAVMAWAGAPSVAEFAAAGVVRVSLGAAIASAAYAVAARATEELLTSGTYDVTADGIDYAATNAALALRPGSSSASSAPAPTTTAPAATAGVSPST